jgi:uncharacterized protein (UPF0262 family)
MTGSSESRQRLVKVTLDEKTLVRRRPEIEHEQAVAIYDLIEDNHFVPIGDYVGPYSLVIRLSENRLVLDIRTEADEPLGKITLPMTPFRTIVRDYFKICESYYDAIRKLSPHQIEAIDMGRRGLHDEGSALLRERLQESIEIDFPTARRLFTLLCVLHLRG